ncbi:hypothetical protein GJAV_G00116260 [Gymnothorax javanicus]|nr:hypothetical protein GJAV_G00116260 [Gymnothorax javanicus]
MICRHNIIHEQVYDSAAQARHPQTNMVWKHNITYKQIHSLTAHDLSHKNRSSIQGLNVTHNSPTIQQYKVVHPEINDLEMQGLSTIDRSTIWKHNVIRKLNFKRYHIT